MPVPFRARPAVFGMACAHSIAFALAIAAAGDALASTRADPADPAAKTKSVGYRSTIAPYTPLRPATPLPWRERNERVTPQPRRDTP